MEIKLATLNDVTQIEDLYEQLLSDMSKLQPQFLQPVRQDVEFIKQSILNETSDILVALSNNEIVGFLLITEQSTPPYPCFIQHKYAYIIDFVVKPQHQGKGIGSALMNEAKSWIKKRQLDYLELSVLAENSGAINLYEKHGFKPRMHTMRWE